MKEKSKQKSILVLIGVSIVPFIVSPTLPSLWTAKETALYFTSVTGFIGVMLILWEYILGTRTVMAKFIDDQTWALKIHKYLGIYGSLLIFLHPLLSIYAYGENILYTIVPNLSTSYEKSVSWGRFAFIILLLTWVTSAVVRGKIAYRPWKYIHYLSYIALPVVILHSPRIGLTLAHSTFAVAYWYIVVSIFLIFAALRMRFIFGFGKTSYTIIENKNIGEDIWLIRLKSEGKAMILSAGQYVYLQTALFHEEHPFSIIDFDRQANELAIAYKVFGRFTKKLTTVEVGRSVLIDGPYGVFTQQVDITPEEQTVFIAGGIGITPFIKHFLSSQTNTRTLFYCNRTLTSGIFQNFLKRKLGEHYIDVLSQDHPIKGPNTESGYITAEIINKYVSEPSKKTFYICGPQGLMDASRHALEQLHVDPHNIYTEEFGF